MKNLNWSYISRAFYLIAMAFVMASTIACGNKDKGKAKVAYRYNTRTNGWQNSPTNSTNGQLSEWGEITGQFSQQLINSFMPNSNVGTVSGRSGDSTGIRFHGSISSGVINMLVYDSIAYQNGDNQAFYWQMNVVNKQISNNNATVIVEDNVGRVTFSGNINSGGVWSGNVTFANSGFDQQTLGKFMINASAILY
ncbi:MAG: hypothetical protein A2Z20_09615 [Bdellovibrionales bacterium RBG_16_40_8]|nr:MAG: hypothetical protein A2Z20_09615 [Bdellovibrionales bacterium RBG_16_40_8]